MAYVRDELQRLWTEAGKQSKRVGEVRKDMSAAANESERRTQDLRRDLTDVAVGSLRWELTGLVLVGLGSILGVLG